MPSLSNGHVNSKCTAKGSRLMEKHETAMKPLRVAGDVKDLDMPKLVTEKQRPTSMMERSGLLRKNIFTSYHCYSWSIQ